MGSRSKARARAKASQPAAPQVPGAQHRPVAGSAQPAAAPSASAQSGSAGSAGSAADRPPRTVLGAAIVQAIEAVAVLAAAIFAGVETGTGHSYQRSSGIAITLIGIGTAIALAFVARGVRGGRRWSRTPALLTQLFTGIVAIYLLQSGRFDWGIPAILLAVVGFTMLLAPASIALLTPGRTGKPVGRS